MGVTDQIVSSHLERLYDDLDRTKTWDQTDDSIYYLLDTWSLAEGWREYIAESGE